MGVGGVPEGGGGVEEAGVEVVVVEAAEAAPLLAAVEVGLPLRLAVGLAVGVVLNVLLHLPGVVDGHADRAQAVAQQPVNTVGVKVAAGEVDIFLLKGILQHISALFLGEGRDRQWLGGRGKLRRRYLRRAEAVGKRRLPHSPMVKQAHKQNSFDTLYISR